MTDQHAATLVPAQLAGGRRRAPARTEPAARTSPAGDRHGGVRFGLQIPRFTWQGGPAEIAPKLRRIAAAAEAAGFEQLWVMDHFRQIPTMGRAWDDMLESWTTLSYLAGVTETIRLGTLVTGVTYRNVAHLAKIVATLDVLSGGRAMCGLGAAWFREEHLAYGWPFPLAARALRPAGGRAAAPATDVGAGDPRLRGRGDHGAGGDLLPATAAGEDPAAGRRLGRAHHAAARRPLRRRLQPVRRGSDGRPQGRGAAPPLRRGRARSGRDRGDAPVDRARRRRPRRGAPARRPACGRPG